MRNRSMALVVRNDKILMVKTFRFNRYIYELPGGGIENGEIPEGEEQDIKSVCWKKLNELSEKDRAFLWSYGLLAVGEYFEHVLSWGDEISYPVG